MTGSSKAAVKSTRTARPKLKESQLQAYGRRQEETVFTPRRAEAAQTAVASPRPAAGGLRAYARSVEEEYAIIRSDLIRLGFVTALMVVLMGVLWFFLG